ncbi:hypothetical protein Pisl_1406 [Pyrobaculum islandicum DSM 4184]|uniref:Archaeal Type IV pilin N-terminal domain-containing protein n=1 Tax=Pyrobaculum islandicum (strain DSM 4184 / JCM 9189 / GEO3) TaxID=384616 RepID=A1RUD3_PYRIL|nr:hypothetical protein [Pyrobaculum islandicum]ABL88565.1 hypothetical protein Pisl_1406 [Pyrobaculum islandicum DSM 4184]
MRGVSEVVVSVLLLVVSLVLSVFVVSVFFNVVYSPSQSGMAVEAAKPLCVARAVAVANDGGVAVVYVYNVGGGLCVFDKAYAIYGGVVYPPSNINYTVPPGAVARINTTLRYGPGFIYRLTGPRGEVVEGRP